MRAIRNGLVAACLLGGLAAQAVCPPRPGADTRLPVVLHRWPDLRPGAPSNPLDLVAAAKTSGGQLRVLVLPAGFKDLHGATATTALQGVFTGKESVADYWQAASGGALAVAGEVVAWRQADQTRSYYAADDNGMDMWAAPRNAGRFVLDAVADADRAGLDWGRYDNDGPDGVPNSGDDDGLVDALVVMHAGPGGECGGDELWSHQFFLAGWGYGRFTTSTARPGGGFVQVDDYVLVPERSCDGGVIEIGVICHEFGHLLGLPDLYDTQGGRAGIGGWGLMGTGGWGGDGQQPESPSLPCAWSRDQLGWAAVTPVRQDGEVVLTDQVLSVRDPEQPAGERWLLENRRRTGFDASLPGEGLLVWHVDDAVIAEARPLNRVNAGPVMGVALEQADGLDQLSGGNRGDAGDPWPGSAGRTRFTGATQPASDDNAGVPTRVALREIPAAAEVMSFHAAMGVTDLDVTPPVVTLVAPVEGEELTLGDLHTVAWTATDDEALGTVAIWLSTDGGASFPRRLAHGLAGVSTWRGTLASEPHPDLSVRVVARDATGNEGAATSGPFALCDRYGPGVALTCDLADGARLLPGETVLVSWETADNVGVAAVDLELSCDGGATWRPTALVDQAPSAASLAWTVPDVACPDGRLRALARDAAGNTGWDASVPFAIAGSTTDVPATSRLRLGPCVPNPFNPRAEIHYALAGAGPVRLSVHDLRGREVRVLVAGHRPAGSHSVIWDGRDDGGRDVASGVYYVRAASRDGAALLKATVVR